MKLVILSGLMLISLSSLAGKNRADALQAANENVQTCKLIAIANVCKKDKSLNPSDFEKAANKLGAGFRDKKTAQKQCQSVNTKVSKELSESGADKTRAACKKWQKVFVEMVENPGSDKVEKMLEQ